MSIFSSDQNYSGTGVSSKLCKRDIESEIKERRKALEREEAFRYALYTYLQDTFYEERKEFTLPELVGLLELSIRAMNINIARLLDELEQEKK
jgi:hypothetical protein